MFSWWNNLFTRNTGDVDIRSIIKMFGSFRAGIFSKDANSLIENGYGKNTDVYSIIKKIVDVLKSVPWVVEHQLGNGEWKLLKDTTIHELMDQPNMGKGYTWNDIEEMLLVYLLCTGNTYVHGATTPFNNLIQELDILPAQGVFIEGWNNNFFIPDYKYRFNYGSSNTILNKENLCHIKYFNPANSFSPMLGMSPIKVAATVIQAGNDGHEANANLRQNRGAVGLITDKSQYPMDPDEAKAVQEKFQLETAGPGKFGKIHVTNKDLNYIQMAMSPSDLQLIEGGVINTRALCTVYSLPSTLFNDPENRTYNSYKEAQKDAFVSCYMPLSDKVAEQLTRFICLNHFPLKRVRMRQDFSKIEVLQENLKEKSEIWAGMKEKGIYTANEVREKFNDPRSADPNADKLIVSSSAMLQSALGQQPTATGTGAGTGANAGA